MEIVKYNVNEAEIAKMSDIYMNLTIKGLDDQEGFEAVHAGRMVMVKYRTAVDKLRKHSNKDAQEFIKNNNANAGKLLGLMEPIETHLKNEEGKITAELERIKAEKEAAEKIIIQKRVDALLAFNVVMPFFDVAMMTDEEYEVKLDAGRAELERVKRERVLQDEIRKLEEENLAKERAEIERMRKEQEATTKAQEEKELALQAKRDAIEAEWKAEQERKEREAFEKQAAENAQIKAEKDAKEKAEREAREKKEREEAEIAEKARQEGLRPDKEKLIAWAKTIKNFSVPAVNDERAQEIVANGLGNLMKIAADITIQAKEL